MAKFNEEALLTAAKKLRRLRIETVGGRKERPARTVGSIIDREGDLKGDVYFVAWVIETALRYYAEAVISQAPKAAQFLATEDGEFNGNYTEDQP